MSQPGAVSMSWWRATALSLAWVVAGTIAVSAAIGVLNGFGLVHGRDEVVALWVAIPSALLLPVISGLYHRSWKVALVVPLFAVLALVVAGIVFLLVVFASVRPF